MNTLLMKQMGLSFLLLAGTVGSAAAATSNSFVNDAAQGGINEVESAKLALEKAAQPTSRRLPSRWSPTTPRPIRS